MTEPVKHTEHSILKMLREKHAEDSGNGPAWAYMEHVRNHAGFTRAGKTKTIDALALHLWESRGHEMHAYEVKVSAADFRSELRKPDKAEAWCLIADRFWIVAPRGVVPKDELPSTWGLLETRKSGDGEVLAVTVQAPLLRPPTARPDLTRGQLAAMLRAAGAGLASTPDAAALAAAEERGRAKGHAEGVRSAGNWQVLYEQDQERAATAVAIQREIEQVLGVDFRTWRSKTTDARVKEVAEALRTVLSEDVVMERLKAQLEQAASTLEGQARWMREHAGRY